MDMHAWKHYDIHTHTHIDSALFERLAYIHCISRLKTLKIQEQAKISSSFTSRPGCHTTTRKQNCAYVTRLRDYTYRCTVAADLFVDVWSWPRAELSLSGSYHKDTLSLTTLCLHGFVYPSIIQARRLCHPLCLQWPSMARKQHR